MQAALGWAYGVVVVGWFVGFLASIWRMWKLREPMSWDLESVALVALLVGWPTGWRIQSQLRRRERDRGTLVTPQTRPLLVAFAAMLVPFLVLSFVPAGAWKPWVSVPLGLAGLVLACATWLRDAHPRPRLS